MATLNYGSPLAGFTDRKKNPVTVRSVSNATFSAFIYKCPLNVDWDGAANAYGLDRPGFPDQMGLVPWESPAHGGSLSNARVQANWSLAWAGIYSVTRTKAIEILRKMAVMPPAPFKGPDVIKPPFDKLLEKFWDNRTQTVFGNSLENRAGDGRFPIVQIPELWTTKKKGYYVSTTSWNDATKDPWDPHAYLDAAEVPYSVIPALAGVKQGDYGLIVRNATGASTPYVCGDSSGADNGSTRLGECSGAIYIAMDLENEGDFSFIVFPHSGNGSSLANTKAAVNAVKSRLSSLSNEDANDLANHLGTNMATKFHVRTALAKWGAPPVVIDAVSGG